MKNPTNKQILGLAGESETCVYLENLGYKIIERNFRSKLGEIDIVALDGNTLVFIEVKSRTNSLFGAPSESVRTKKLRSFIKSALLFIKYRKDLPENLRFDVIEVYNLYGRFEINHIKNITL